MNEFDELKTEIESGVKRIKLMINNLENGDLYRLNRQLWSIIEFATELAELLYDYNAEREPQQIFVVK